MVEVVDNDDDLDDDDRWLNAIKRNLIEYDIMLLFENDENIVLVVWYVGHDEQVEYEKYKHIDEPHDEIYKSIHCEPLDDEAVVGGLSHEYHEKDMIELIDVEYLVIHDEVELEVVDEQK